MSSGIIQLVATGVQDTFLTGTPEISFFRSNFKRYTHFAMSNELQLINGPPSNAGVSTIRFEKKGDLMSYVYITARNNGVVQNVNNWAAQIDKLEFLIGGQVIDTQDVFFSNTVSPMFLNTDFSKRYAPGVGSMFLPLQFFFCKDIQSAIPLVALQYHDVELRITWNTPTAGWEFRVFANFIYLDTDERKHLAEKPQHDILIYQVQRVVTQPIFNQEIVFNHPVKFITFPTIPYTNLTHTLKMQVNGMDIGIDRPLFHYSQVAPYYHTSYGLDPTSSAWNATPMALIPFCLETSKLQPTGSINFSRIDSFRLVTDPSRTIQGISDATKTQYIYAVNYNVLRISQGMGGMLFAS